MDNMIININNSKNYDGFVLSDVFCTISSMVDKKELPEDIEYYEVASLVINPFLSNEEKTRIYSNYINQISNETIDKYIYLIRTIVSTVEFPPTEYTDTNEPDKIPLDFEGILKREREVIPRGNDLFISINDYCKLEFSDVFILNRGIGKKVIDKTKLLLINT